MGTLNTARHRRAAAALLLPVIIGMAGCAAEDKAPAGEAVYGRPLAEQFQAATDATRDAGTAVFSSTLTYGAAGGDAVDRTRGSLDYARGTSFAKLGLDADRHFPAGLRERLGAADPKGGRVLATSGEDVYVRHGASSWLKFTPRAVNELGESTGVIAAHAAGDAAPYSGTLADLVPRLIPREKPVRKADGSRVYAVTALPEVASELLPRDLQSLQGDWGLDPVDVTVRLDADGRLSSATADLGPVLDRLHEQRELLGVKRLRAAFALSAFGEPVKGKGPSGGKGAEDAAEVLAPVAGLADGRCATTGDTGLGAAEVVRPVDCAKPHDLRVLGHVKVDRTLPGDPDVRGGDGYARTACERVYAAAPKDWRRGGAYADGFSVMGDSEVTLTVGQGGTETTVTGAYTCYLQRS
ncbi:hypothetical protein OG206_10135 [Streptomyces sp. NBC_01341]|uniref:hypothetical protein n=1 Tax=Streptomyces sp. NBC_01341 TaxID=2903831 RepID=UPI002E12924C|nr:hypothetical protein OG206_10135 [Streptomyces sp. NBC_01341]